MKRVMGANSTKRKKETKNGYGETVLKDVNRGFNRVQLTKGRIKRKNDRIIDFRINIGISKLSKNTKK
jgi:hypothetical protein